MSGPTDPESYFDEEMWRRFARSAGPEAALEALDRLRQFGERERWPEEVVAAIDDLRQELRERADG